MVEVSPVQTPHKTNIYKLLAIIATNIDSIRNGLQSNHATRDALFKIIQAALVLHVKEVKLTIVSENTFISMGSSALVHHLNEVYDEEEVESN